MTVNVKGNRVTNGDFEQPNDEGTEPAGWQGSSTGAGTTSWNEEPSSDGTATNRSATITGTGRSVLLNGVPTWTSDAIAVAPGEVLSLLVDVRTEGMSSAPTVGLAYLGATGEVLQTVNVLAAPLKSNGFPTLESTFSVPLDVSAVRIVLAGFSPTDTRTRGTVTFDNVGLYAE